MSERGTENWGEIMEQCLEMPEHPYPDTVRLAAKFTTPDAVARALTVAARLAERAYAKGRIDERATVEQVGGLTVTTMKLDLPTVGDARLPPYRRPTFWDRVVGAWRGLVSGWRDPR